MRGTIQSFISGNSSLVGQPPCWRTLLVSGPAGVSMRRQKIARAVLLLHPLLPRRPRVERPVLVQLVVELPDVNEGIQAHLDLLLDELGVRAAGVVQRVEEHE